MSFFLGFNQSSSVIQLDTTGIGIYSDSQVSAATRLLRLNQTGMEIWRNGYRLGKIGTNGINGYPDYRGLVFDLDVDGSYMTWASRTSTESNYTTVLTYAKAGAIFDHTGFYIGGAVYMKGNTLNKANLTETRSNGNATFNGTKTFVTAVRSTANGGIEYDTATCTISNGMFIN